MKRYLLVSAPVIMILVASCSTTNFSEYRGASVFEGKGGTVRVVEGIDFWENGEPDRKFKILGVIEDTRGEGLISRSSRDGTLAKTAREHGGDAIIFVTSSRELHGMDLESGTANYKRITKLLVAKYSN